MTEFGLSSSLSKGTYRDELVFTDDVCVAMDGPSGVPVKLRSVDGTGEIGPPSATVARTAEGDGSVEALFEPVWLVVGWFGEDGDNVGAGVSDVVVTCGAVERLLEMLED